MDLPGWKKKYHHTVTLTKVGDCYFTIGRIYITERMRVQNEFARFH